MLKKAMPLFLISGIVLAGCGTDNTVPKNNETPMENIEDRTKDWTPKVRDDERGGTNLDGIDERQDGTGNGMDGGVINDNNQNTNNNNRDTNDNMNRDNTDSNDDNMNDNLDRPKDNDMNNR